MHELVGSQNPRPVVAPTAGLSADTGPAAREIVLDQRGKLIQADFQRALDAFCLTAERRLVGQIVRNGDSPQAAASSNTGPKGEALLGFLAERLNFRGCFNIQTLSVDQAAAADIKQKLLGLGTGTLTLKNRLVRISDQLYRLSPEFLGKEFDAFLHLAEKFAARFREKIAPQENTASGHEQPKSERVGPLDTLSKELGLGSPLKEQLNALAPQVSARLQEMVAEFALAPVGHSASIASDLAGALSKVGSLLSQPVVRVLALCGSELPKERRLEIYQLFQGLHDKAAVAIPWLSARLAMPQLSKDEHLQIARSLLAANPEQALSAFADCLGKAYRAPKGKSYSESSPGFTAVLAVLAEHEGSKPLAKLSSGTQKEIREFSRAITEHLLDMSRRVGLKELSRQCDLTDVCSVLALARSAAVPSYLAQSFAVLAASHIVDGKLDWARCDDNLRTSVSKTLSLMAKYGDINCLRVLRDYFDPSISDSNYKETYSHAIKGIMSRLSWIGQMIEGTRNAWAGIKWDGSLAAA